MAKGPLNKSHLGAIQEAERKLQEALPHIDALECTGRPCQQYKEDIAYLLQQFSVLKQRYFPQGSLG